ncbi:hypothetical protein [Bosea sp. UNC402CLCol]|uniref:hypothetical protein n=1 Tax=Bosea sp. UNC402CLCol TaxID=1510531 RepID=UPI00056DD894|nr:hypothetical protein [Bosea sp. UNC402CLCol]
MPAVSRPWARLLLIDIVLLVSMGLVGLGLATSDVLVPTGWSAATVRSLELVVGVSVAATLMAMRLQRHAGLNQDVFIAAGLLFLCGGVFGPAAGAAVALLVVAALVCGTALLEGCHPDAPVSPVAVRLSLGLAVATIILTLLSPIRVNFPLVHLAVLALLATPLLRSDVRARLSADRLALSQPGPPLARGPLIWRMMAVALLVFFMLHAALPERYHDALAVHLYVASYIAAHGEWAYDPGLFVFAVIPLAADFLYAHVYLFAGEPAVKLLNYVTFLVIAALIGGSVTRRYGKPSGLIAALLYASMPLTLVETASSFIENPLTMWITAAAVILFERGRGVSLCEIAAILLLLAAATLTKVHGAIASVMLGSLAVGFYLSTRRRPAELARLAVCLVVMGSVALSSYAYAYWITGNPVFPFFNNVFKSPLYPPVQFVDGRWIGRFNLELLYQATFHSDRFLEAYNGAMGFSLAAFLPAALAVVVVGPQGLRLLALVFAGFIFAIGSSTQYLRYFYPTLPIAFFFIGLLASWYLADRRRAVIFSLAAFVVIGLNVYKLNAGGWIMANYDFSMIFDGQKARRYEQAFVPEKSLFRIVNQLQGRSARVLLSGVSSAAPLEGTALYTSWYSEDFSRYGAAAKSGADVEAYLRRVKPTYIVHRSPPEPSYPFHALLDAEVARLGRKIATIGSVTLYETVVP